MRSTARRSQIAQDPSALRRAAQYVRMSTEHQQYSIANQSAAIALYAAAHNLGVVRAFVDGGKTGTTIKGRWGLQELLRIVESGSADFDEILVYDVSRWGRFLDSDEGAHYEFLCKRAGIAVRYCAEQFENDNSTTSNLLKALKRTMAGEYSRELSVKVSAGQQRLAMMGFWQGGSPPFGMIRQIVDENGKPKEVLQFGQWKSISTDRVVLIPGPPEATRTIRLAFNLYTKQKKSRREIVKILNAKKVLQGQTPWTVSKLRLLYIDPIHKGAYAYCKHDCKFHKSKDLPQEKWLVREHAFPGTVSDRQWEAARERLLDEVKPLVDAQMLESLRGLWERKGKLNSTIINAEKEIPSAVAYFNHFGSINQAYKLIGYPLPKDYTFLHAIEMARGLRRTLCEEIRQRVLGVGGTAENLSVPGKLLLNHKTTLQVSICKGWDRPQLPMLWKLMLGKQAAADLVVIARLRPPEQKIFDYFVIPALSQLHGGLNVREKDNAPFLELYRFDDLQTLINAFRRSPL